MRKLVKMCSTALFIAFTCSTLYGQAIPSKYHTYDEMTRAIKNLASSHGDILKVESLGKTLKGRDIWVMTRHPNHLSTSADCRRGTMRLAI